MVEEEEIPRRMKRFHREGEKEIEEGTEEEPLEETPEKKPGFFSKLFRKKPTKELSVEEQKEMSREERIKAITEDI